MLNRMALISDEKTVDYIVPHALGKTMMCVKPTQAD
ncbi:hypothetical protein EPYR_02456 [Erwinia pyrifoliae DSM 12163]|nr:hypothetical protein EPYR_02456 [Erwinia pyrifoliae DSM 12163]